MTTLNRRSSPALHIALWVLQVLLLLVFGAAGVAKLVAPAATLPTFIPWTADVPLLLVRFIGLAELAGALGLVLPALSRIRPKVLVPLAAIGLMTVMLLASGFHLLRGEGLMGASLLIVVALCGVVAWGRSRAAPFSP